MPESGKRLEVMISGRVQGVWFRGSTQEMALSLGLAGWVRNLPDGRVQAVFEGPAPTLERMLAWCHQGPPHARVDRVEYNWSEAAGGSRGFRIVG